VVHEPFRQLVMEDRFVDGARPPWERAGVEIAGDVVPYEHMKLRLLNGAHSALAYLGLPRGHATVAEAIADPWLADFVAAMIGDEVIPTLHAGFDLDAYAAETLARFRNPAIGHTLAQIAWDGSHKLPYRLLGTIADARAAGRPFARLALAVAAWMRFVQRAGGEAVDPLAARFRGLPGEDAALLDSLLALRQIFPAALAADPQVCDAFAAGLAALKEKAHA